MEPLTLADTRSQFATQAITRCDVYSVVPRRHLMEAVGPATAWCARLSACGRCRGSSYSDQHTADALAAVTSRASSGSAPKQMESSRSALVVYVTSCLCYVDVLRETPIRTDVARVWPHTLDWCCKISLEPLQWKVQRYTGTMGCKNVYCD